MSLMADYRRANVWRAAAIPWAFVALLIAPPPATVCAQENLVLKPPQGWKPGGAPQQTKDTLLLEFVKEGDAIASWKELITMQQFRRGKTSPSPREFYDSAKMLRAGRCPGVTEWQIVEELEGGLTYEWQMTGPCEGEPPQSELVRLIYAKRTWYRVAYTTRSELTPEARQEWIGWLRSLKLER